MSNKDEENFGYDVEDEDTLFIDLEDENGNMISCPVVDQFEYEEKVYVLAQSPDPEDDSLYIFRVEGEGENAEVVYLDEEEFDRVATYYEEELADSE